MKKNVIVILLILSVALNAFLVGKWWLEQAYIPTDEERVILSELVKKTLESDDYQKIAKKHQVIAIEPTVDKRNGGAYPYYFEVSVRTTDRTYLFMCENEACTKVVNSGTTYSIYQDEKPSLPLK